MLFPGVEAVHRGFGAVLEDASFHAPERASAVVRFEAEDVRSKLQAIVQDQQLSRFIL